MPQFKLFGRSRTIGDQPGAGSLRVASAFENNGREVVITIDGSLGIAVFTGLRYRFEARFDQDFLVYPAAPKAAEAGSLTVIVGGQSSRFNKPDAQRSPDADVALELLSPSGTTVGGGAAAAFAKLFDGIADYEPSPSARTAFRLTEPGGVARLVPVSRDQMPGLLLSSLFTAGLGDASIEVHQLLPIESLELGGESASIRFLPPSAAGAVLLQPDLLDPRHLSQGDGNAFLFQFGIAGADLQAEVEFTSNQWQASRPRFVGRAGAKVQLVPLALRDEHGHPPVLELDELPVTLRHGNVQIADDSDQMSWSRTNRAMVLEETSEAGLKAELLSMDPIALYDRDRRPPKLDDRGRVNSRPYWIENGRVPVAPSQTLELHGFARSSSLAGKKNKALPRQGCLLKCEPVRDGNSLLYMHTSLDMPVDDLELRAEFPEQSNFLRGSGPAAPVGVQRRVSPGRVRERVGLPLHDIGWSLANLGGVPSMTGEWAAKGDGLLAGEAAKWLETGDLKWRTGPQGAFDAPQAAGYEHVEGHRAAIPDELWARILKDPPASTLAGQKLQPERVGLSEPVITADPAALVHLPALVSDLAVEQAPPEASRTRVLFGGTQAPGDVEREAQLLDARVKTLGGPAERFLRRWTGLEVPEGVNEEKWWQALRALKSILAGELFKLPDPEELSLEEELAVGELQFALERFFIDAASRNLPPELGLEGAAAGFQNLGLPDFVRWWNDALDEEEEGSAGRLLIDLYRAPPNLETLRRAAAAMANPAIADLDPELRAYLDQQLLPQALRDAVDAMLSGAQANLDGFLAEISNGLDSVFAAAAEVWRTEMASLHAKYGPKLTEEVYQALLKAEQDAALFLKELELGGILLRRLGDLLSDPPDYVLISRRLRRLERGDAGDDGTALHPTQAPGAKSWNGRFDLCTLGGSAWDFFLDDDTSIILKLGGRRSLGTIIEEVDRAYRSADRPNPLGIITDPKLPGRPAEQLAADLPPELKTADWRGAFVVAPSLDLARDELLSTLCGFKYLKTLWVAVGGRSPKPTSGEPMPALKTWAHVKRIEPAKKKPQDSEESDVSWSLVSFDVEVRASTVYSGEIAFLLRLNELLGARSENEKWNDVKVQATLPPATAGDAGKPRAFSFAANFEKPEVFKIDLAFLDKLSLRSIRVGSRQGEVSLDVDADLDLQKWPPLQVPKTQLRLEDFRIRIPRLADGVAIPMGILRALSFDLPAIRFPSIKARQVSVMGVEITPVGLGLYRGTPKEIEARLNRESIEVVAPGFGGGGKQKFAYPFVDLKVDFGELPVFGGSNSKLEMTGLLGVPVFEGKLGAGTPGFAVGSAKARNIKFDLFRILTLTIEELSLGNYPRKSAIGGADGRAGVLLVENWTLKIIGWEFLKDFRKDLLLAHDSELPHVKGMFAMATKNKKQEGDGEDEDEDAAAEEESKKKKFFRLHWMLLTRNLDIGRDLKTSLLERPDDLDKKDEQVTFLEEVFEKDDNGQRTLNADFGGTGGEWLFGIRFGLGDIFDPCTLILHDGRFYGIGLRAEWLESLTGLEELTFAYIPGRVPAEDRFRASLRIAALELFAPMSSGVIVLEWGPNWDFLIDLGFPWRGPNGYDWFRAFSIPMGGYEAKFGLFIEKRTETGIVIPGLPEGRYLTLGAGFGFYFGYFFQGSFGPAWVRAGIGVFGILSGRATLLLVDRDRERGSAFDVLKSSIAQLEIIGVLGIFAYGEGGVEVWILSARFRVAAQAAATVHIVYRPKQPVSLKWDVLLNAHYSASVRVGRSPFKWTFKVSGRCGMKVSGRTVLG
jgi:hypothetical protein